MYLKKFLKSISVSMGLVIGLIAVLLIEHGVEKSSIDHISIIDEALADAGGGGGGGGCGCCGSTEGDGGCGSCA